jgi:hypothetical protein
MPSVYSVNIDDVFFWECFFRATPNYLSFTSTGVTLYCYDGKSGGMSATKTWTYEGTDTFLGFSTTSGSSVATYQDGDTLSVDNLSANLNLYSVTKNDNETYLTNDIDLASVANAIRTKGNIGASLAYPTGYVNAINALPTGTLQSYKSAIYTSPGTATILPDSGYVGIAEISVEYSPAVYDGAYHTESGLTDLTGTTWTFNNTISYAINQSSASNPLSLNFSDGTYNYTKIGDGVSRGSIFVEFIGGLSNLVYYGNWQTGAPPTISITGGTDAKNATLIAWFQANATQVS